MKNRERGLDQRTGSLGLTGRLPRNWVKENAKNYRTKCCRKSETTVGAARKRVVGCPIGGEKRRRSVSQAMERKKLVEICEKKKKKRGQKAEEQ